MDFLITIFDLESRALISLMDGEYYDILINEIVAHNNIINIPDFKNQIKVFKGFALDNKTQYNKLTTESESSYIKYYLYLIKMSINTIPITNITYCDYMKSLYVRLSGISRITSRYFKLPVDWMSIGYYAGLLEDMVVVMRTIVQLKISDTHMILLSNFIKNYRKFFSENLPNASRFIFMLDLFSSNDDQYIMDMLIHAISLQGYSQRIGIYDDSTGKFIYAIQGIFSCSYDPRVVKYLTPDNTIPYAIHFTKREIANAIWNKSTTISTKTNSEIPTGEICRFNRVIHAITDIINTSNGFMIGNSLKNLKSRMSHGIRPSDDGRMKYESGLVIDVKRLVSILPEKSVMINQIGTLLVDRNIPHECLIDCIDTDEKLDFFWQI
jgi:hypothetical protein